MRRCPRAPAPPARRAAFRPPRQRWCTRVRCKCPPPRRPAALFPKGQARGRRRACRRFVSAPACPARPVRPPARPGSTSPRPAPERADAKRRAPYHRRQNPRRLSRTAWRARWRAASDRRSAEAARWHPADNARPRRRRRLRPRADRPLPWWCRSALRRAQTQTVPQGWIRYARARR